MRCLCTIVNVAADQNRWLGSMIKLNVLFQEIRDNNQNRKKDFYDFFWKSGFSSYVEMTSITTDASISKMLQIGALEQVKNDSVLNEQWNRFIIIHDRSKGFTSWMESMLATKCGVKRIA
jgi:hypothetical protein